MGWRGLAPSSTRLGSGGQWRVDEALVLVSHDPMWVGGPHVAEPPGLTFGRWLGKRGSHEASLPLSAPQAPCRPHPRSCPLGTCTVFTYLLLLAFLFPSSSHCSVCAYMACEHVCLCECEQGGSQRTKDSETGNPLHGFFLIMDEVSSIAGITPG